MQRYLRDPFSGLSHLAAALLAAGGTVLLVLRTSGGAGRRVPMLIYGLSLTLLFTASAVYHLSRAPQQRLALLRKLDHSAIYLLIAGSYTPISYLILTGAYRAATLIAIWLMAIGGIVYKVFAIGRRWIYTLLYVLMGWLGILLIGQLSGRLPTAALGWLVAGGVLYTVGALGYALKWPRLWPQRFSFHEVWHLFVIGGALCHYLMHVLYLAPL